jgi:hypothetical protein
MEHFHTQEIKMRATKHLALQKFEPIDMSLRDAITPLGRESGANGGIISTNPVDKAAQFGYVRRFCLLELLVNWVKSAQFLR